MWGIWTHQGDSGGIPPTPPSLPKNLGRPWRTDLKYDIICYAMKLELSKLTLDEFFWAAVNTYADHPVMAFVGKIPFTYWELGERVKYLQLQLRQLGLKKQDKVVILGANSPNWSITFLAVMTMGAVAVPVMTEFPEPDIEYIISHSEARAIFIDENLYNALSLPSLEEIPIVFDLTSLTLLGDAAGLDKLWSQLHHIPDKLKQTREKSVSTVEPPSIREDDLAQILYTSGTTGHTKGVMLTHKNLASNLIAGPELIRVVDETSVILGILPLAHAFGSTITLLSVLYCGASMYYMDKKPSPKVLLKAMQTVKPTFIGAVPLIFEKIYQRQVIPAISGNAVLRQLVKFAPGRKLVYRLIGHNVKKAFGGRLEGILIGGASLSSEVELFLREGRVPYVVGYGLSECSPLVSGSTIRNTRLGSVGHPIPEMQVKIVDPNPETGIGEILVKGPNVMQGYYKNEAETRQVFTNDGWLITGDRGCFDQDNYLYIKGRSKNVIIGPSGENIYPEIIEDKLKASPFVEEALVFQLENQLTARIYPDYTYIQSLEKNKSEDEIATDIEQILEDVRWQVNTLLPTFSQIQKVIEQRSPFIKTPTNKIKRAEYVPDYSADRR